MSKKITKSVADYQKDAERVKSPQQNTNQKTVKTASNINNEEVNYSELAQNLLNDNPFSAFEAEVLLKRLKNMLKQDNTNEQLRKRINRLDNMVKYYYAAVGKVVKNIDNPDYFKAATRRRDKRLRELKNYYLKETT